MKVNIILLNLSSYIFISTLFVSTLVGQKHFNCGNTPESKLDEIELSLEIAKNNKAFYEWKAFKPNGRSSSSNIIIPVHVIVIHDPADAYGEGGNISESRIQDQIEVLNSTFSGLNKNINETPGGFSRGQSSIRFCLASLDPDGNPTLGITRYPTTENFQLNEREIVESTFWSRDTYLNIYVVPELIDLLGYSSRPVIDSLPQPAIDDVVRVLTSTFGGPESATFDLYDQGRVATHEVGHWLGLTHTWGGGCGSDDGFNDTPEQSEPNYNCPEHPSPSCGNSGDMFMNYMDYTVDGCKTAFSQDQCDFMEMIISEVRTPLLNAGERAISDFHIPRILLDSKTDATCPRGASGEISLSVKGGSSPYEFSLDGTDFQSSPVFSGLVKGIYEITVRDFLNESSKRTFEIGEPVEFNVNLELISDSCPLQKNGAISIAAEGANLGTSNMVLTSSEISLSGSSLDTVLNEGFENGFPFNWSKQSEWRVGTSENSSSSFFDIPPHGSFIVFNDDTLGFNNFHSGAINTSVIDLNGSDDFIVSFEAYFTQLSFWGAIESARFLISKDNGQSFQPVAFLTRKSDWYKYSFEYRDFGSDRIILRFEYDDGGSANAGLALDNIIIESSKPVIFEDLFPGDYLLEITDPEGCQYSEQINIPESEIVQITSIQIDEPTCTDGGSIIVNANSINTISEYKIGNNINSTGRFTNLGPGSYVVEVFDEQGCSESIAVDLVSENDVTINLVNLQDIICSDDLASFSVNVTGGTGESEYYLNGVKVNGDEYQDIVAGSYSLIVIDEIGCSDTLNLEFIKPEPLEISIATTDEDCFSRGTINVTTLGGLAPYSYNLNGGQYGNISSFEVPAGNHVVMIRDANECIIMREVVIENADSNIELVEELVSCSAAPEMSYVVRYCLESGNVADWNIIDNSGNSIATYYESECVEVDLSPLLDINQDFFQYDLIINTSNGCESRMMAEVSTPPILPGFSEEIISLCGNTEYIYQIDASIAERFSDIVVTQSGDEIMPNETNTNIEYTMYPDGIYTIGTVDINGCSSTYTLELAGLPYPQLELVSVFPATDSDDGVINVSAMNGTAPLEYKLLQSGIVNDTGIFEDLQAGTYTIQCIDANGCISETLEVLVDMVSSTNHSAATNTVDVFPNPAHSILNINSSNIFDISKIEIYSINGNLITSTNLLSTEIDVSDLVTGLYMIKMNIEEKIVIKRFIKI